VGCFDRNVRWFALNVLLCCCVDWVDCVDGVDCVDCVDWFDGICFSSSP